MIINYKLTQFEELVNAVNDDGTWTTFKLGSGQMSDNYQAWLDLGNTPEEYQTAAELAAIEATAYIGLRQAEYSKKSWGEQLDMQYWDRVNLTTLYDDWIASIKAMYPKPV